MGWFTSAFNSSLGKKYVMAITGFFLLIYLVIHLFGNSFLYFGPAAFNTYVEALTESGLKPVIRVIEVVLLLGFLFHIYNGVRLQIGNWRARPQRYAVRPEDPQATLASRTMWISASVIFFFLVIHIQQFWYVYHYARTGNMHMYDLVVNAFTNPVFAVIYLVSVFLLFFHLYHGFQSAFQSLGWNHLKYRTLIVVVGKIYAVVIGLGFASFPIYFYFMGGK
ncbi:MAG TPA: succinate dehydrogenase cytochrome b subunit [Ignavibacteriales bacterium]|nr:succinate dehydrogenase cytochrome b subunit [Ignavibacteriales bacterium]